jgi:hypothetical protein
VDEFTIQFSTIDILHLQHMLERELYDAKQRKAMWAEKYGTGGVGEQYQWAVNCTIFQCENLLNKIRPAYDKITHP